MSTAGLKVILELTSLQVAVDEVIDIVMHRPTRKEPGIDKMARKYSCKKNFLTKVKYNLKGSITSQALQFSPIVTWPLYPHRFSYKVLSPWETPGNDRSETE